MSDPNKEPIEINCPMCGGAGLRANTDKTTWKVELCRDCNGIGRLLWIVGRSPIAYDDATGKKPILLVKSPDPEPWTRADEASTLANADYHDHDSRKRA